jgi:hypothetical protein
MRSFNYALLRGFEKLPLNKCNQTVSYSIIHVQLQQGELNQSLKLVRVHGTSICFNKCFCN